MARPIPEGMLHRNDRHRAPMSKSIFQYLWYARYFERLAGVLSNEEVQILLRSQAETCRRLAVKNGRAAHVTIIPNGHRG